MNSVLISLLVFVGETLGDRVPADIGDIDELGVNAALHGDIAQIFEITDIFFTVANAGEVNRF